MRRSICRRSKAKLSEVTTSHHLTRQFFNILHADIHRANELELTNASLLAEQKRLSEQLQRREPASSRSAKLRSRPCNSARQPWRRTSETLRTALAAARLELVEAANTIAQERGRAGRDRQDTFGQDGRGRKTHARERGAARKAGQPVDRSRQVAEAGSRGAAQARRDLGDPRQRGGAAHVELLVRSARAKRRCCGSRWRLRSLT